MLTIEEPVIKQLKLAKETMFQSLWLTDILYTDVDPNIVKYKRKAKIISVGTVINVYRYSAGYVLISCDNIILWVTEEWLEGIT